MSKINDMFAPFGNKSSKENKRAKSKNDKPVEDDLINYTVGLVSASKYKEIKDNLEILRLEKLRKKSNDQDVKTENTVKKKRVLSFNEDDLTCAKTSLSISKDPTTCTSFLRDSKREKELLEERERLTRLFYQNKNKEKKELVDIFYSYWDGTDHFKTITLPKETTIGEFINKCIKDLMHQYCELKSASCNTMIYVKQDTIIPNDMTFFEIIQSKLRGKTGPLYDKPTGENSITDRLNAGKIVDKQWYERNQHAFPACNWEKYNPHKLAQKTQLLDKLK